MGCFDSVEEFVKRYGVVGYIRRFELPVETVESASQVAGADPSDIVKTIIVSYGSEYAAIIVPGNCRVDLKKVSQVLGVGKVRLARPNEIRELTGFDVGGVSPLSECTRRNTKVVLDTRVLAKSFIWCGGGDRYSLAYVSVRSLVEVLNPLVADVSLE
ncbi:MAG: aminoacyl-tRNA deacylase [Desulfurococcaceae archaeon]|nr:aminoacyl-tRNA deacylase [Desulfurococcaceae archaeon]